MTSREDLGTVEQDSKSSCLEGRKRRHWKTKEL